MNFKKVLAILLAVVMVFSFAACGEKKEAKEEKKELKWPEKDIAVVVPVAAGSGTDIIAREFATELNALHPEIKVTVENIVGGAQATGIMDALSRDHDGYTFMMIPPAGLLTNPIKNPEIGYSLKDIQVVAPLHPDTVASICVLKDSPIQTYDDFLKYIKEHDDFNSGIPTVGGFGHIAAVCAMNQIAEKENAHAGLFTQYDSNQGVLQYMTNGEALFGILDDNYAKTVIESGQVRAIATIATTRSQFLPDTPALLEVAPYLTDLDAVGGFKQVCVASDVPADVLAALKAEVDKVLLSDTYNKYLTTLNYATFQSIPSTDEMQKIAEAGVDVYKNVLKVAGIIQ